MTTMNCDLKLLNAITIWVCLYCFSCSVVSNTKQQLAFAVNFPGSPPYLYLEEKSQTYQGLVVDFFLTIKDAEGLQVEFLEVNRARSEQFIYDGKADLFLSSLAWVKHPEKVLSTEPLILNHTYLYSTQPFVAEFDLHSLTSEHICTRFSYVYPALEPYFQDRVSRVDSSSQTTMLSMMLGNRCDYSIINEYNAMSLMNAAPFCDQTFYRSPKTVNSVPNAFLLKNSQQTLVTKINKYLKRFKSSDKFKASLHKHTRKLSSGCNNKQVDSRDNNSR